MLSFEEALLDDAAAPPPGRLSGASASASSLSPPASRAPPRQMSMTAMPPPVHSRTAAAASDPSAVAARAGPQEECWRHGRVLARLLRAPSSYAATAAALAALATSAPNSVPPSAANGATPQSAGPDEDSIDAAVHCAGHLALVFGGARHLALLDAVARPSASPEAATRGGVLLELKEEDRFVAVWFSRATAQDAPQKTVPAGSAAGGTVASLVGMPPSSSSSSSSSTPPSASSSSRSSSALPATAAAGLSLATEPRTGSGTAPSAAASASGEGSGMGGGLVAARMARVDAEPSLHLWAVLSNGRVLRWEWIAVSQSSLSSSTASPSSSSSTSSSSSSSLSPSSSSSPSADWRPVLTDRPVYLPAIPGAWWPWRSRSVRFAAMGPDESHLVWVEATPGPQSMLLVARVSWTAAASAGRVGVTSLRDRPPPAAGPAAAAAQAPADPGPEPPASSSAGWGASEMLGALDGAGLAGAVVAGDAVWLATKGGAVHGAEFRTGRFDRAPIAANERVLLSRAAGCGGVVMLSESGAVAELRVGERPRPVCGCLVTNTTVQSALSRLHMRSVRDFVINGDVVAMLADDSVWIFDRFTGLLLERSVLPSALVEAERRGASPAAGLVARSGIALLNGAVVETDGEAWVRLAACATRFIADAAAPDLLFATGVCMRLKRAKVAALADASVAMGDRLMRASVDASPLHDLKLGLVDAAVRVCRRWNLDEWCGRILVDAVVQICDDFAVVGGGGRVEDGVVEVTLAKFSSQMSQHMLNPGVAVAVLRHLHEHSRVRELLTEWIRAYRADGGAPFHMLAPINETLAARFEEYLQVDDKMLKLVQSAARVSNGLAAPTATAAAANDAAEDDALAVTPDALARLSIVDLAALSDRLRANAALRARLHVTITNSLSRDAVEALLVGGGGSGNLERATTGRSAPQPHTHPILFEWLCGVYFVLMPDRFYVFVDALFQYAQRHGALHTPALEPRRVLERALLALPLARDAAALESDQLSAATSVLIALGRPVAVVRFLLQHGAVERAAQYAREAAATTPESHYVDMVDLLLQDALRAAESDPPAGDAAARFARAAAMYPAALTAMDLVGRTRQMLGSSGAGPGLPLSVLQDAMRQRAQLSPDVAGV